MTLPESGGLPLVSCRRMLQTDGRRLDAGLGRKCQDEEARRHDTRREAGVKPFRGAGREIVYHYRDTGSQPRDGAPRRSCALDLGG
jgi:hypothetical protein